LFLGTDEWWRWRSPARWTYHARWWGRVLAWSLVSEAGATATRGTLRTDRAEYAPDVPIVIEWSTERPGGASTPAEVEVEIWDEGGELVRVVALAPLEGDPSRYTAALRGLETGRYRLTRRGDGDVDETGAGDAATSGDDTPESPRALWIRVAPSARSEWVDLAARWARWRDGPVRVRPATEGLGWIEEIPVRRRSRDVETSTSLLAGWIFPAALASLLAAEWVGRRRTYLL
jgi:hypothetical protein